MPVKQIKQKGLTWTNISSVNEESIEFLKKNFKFHHLDIEDIKSESQNPKLDTYKDYLFLVVHFPQWRADIQKITHHEIDIFVGPDFLITIQHGKNKEIKDFFYRSMNNRKVRNEWTNKTSGYLLYKILESLFSQSRLMLNTVGKQISNIENDIFSDKQDIDVIRQLAIYRRNVLNFKRILDPQRFIVSTLSNIRKPFLDESLSIYFDDIKDYLDKLWVIVDTYKETLDGLHITVESLINQKTNKIITLLTVISVSLMPLTLLSGIYGMNIDGLPFAHNPWFVWGLFIAIATFILFLIFIMKKKKTL
ncbi:MAG: magnesium transporter CorA family protein [Candidatus Magasanikbacteria bacterium]